MIGDAADLRDQVRAIMDFFDPRIVDTDLGGYFQGLRDDGSIYDRATRHLVGTTRYIYNYATSAALLDRPGYLDRARHGLDFLQSFHRQGDGGYAWVLRGRDVVDPTRHAYGHAFVLLAVSAAARAGVAEARPLIGEVSDLLEARFWEPAAGLYADVIADGDWSAIDPYRGQNANMHLCEAMLEAYDATGEDRYLDRAHGLARRICLDLTVATDGLIWEHYSSDWTHDWTYNIGDPKNLFRPFGYLPGHFVEWSKLLLLLHRRTPEPWMVERAAFLFDAAVDKAWDNERGGFNYAFGPDGAILDDERYYWVFAEALAAAALLGAVADRADIWRWYDTIWAYCDTHLIDHVYGGWFRVLDADGRKLSDRKSPPAESGYHPLSACVVALGAIDRRRLT